MIFVLSQEKGRAGTREDRFRAFRCYRSRTPNPMEVSVDSNAGSRRSNYRHTRSLSPPPSSLRLRRRLSNNPPKSHRPPLKTLQISPCAGSWCDIFLPSLNRYFHPSRPSEHRVYTLPFAKCRHQQQPRRGLSSSSPSRWRLSRSQRPLKKVKAADLQPVQHFDRVQIQRGYAGCQGITFPTKTGRAQKNHIYMDFIMCNPTTL